MKNKSSNPTEENPGKLVKEAGLRAALFQDAQTAPSYITLWRMRRRKQIPFIRIGKAIFYDVSAVRRALGISA
jgi:hypothetical protein